MDYLNSSGVTAETFDEDGRLHRISDCIREAIKVNGIAVALVELEDLRHPVFKGYTILGVPHDTMGEVPRDYVMLKQAHRDKDKKAVEEEIIGVRQEEQERKVEVVVG
ncbi:hypothetical protein HOY80DRAFT_283572 [Tuber brumale]|nr:hypothetical protein HOY80DRAFT_283572 [Tuber brumale]